MAFEDLCVRSANWTGWWWRLREPGCPTCTEPAQYVQRPGSLLSPLSPTAAGPLLNRFHSCRPNVTTKHTLSRAFDLTLWPSCRLREPGQAGEVETAHAFAEAFGRVCSWCPAAGCAHPADCSLLLADSSLGLPGEGRRAVRVGCSRHWVSGPRTLPSRVFPLTREKQISLCSAASVSRSPSEKSCMNSRNRSRTGTCRAKVSLLMFSSDSFARCIGHMIAGQHLTYSFQVFLAFETCSYVSVQQARGVS